MSTASLKNAVTGTKPATQEPKSLAALLVQPNVQKQIATALPKHMTSERLARIVTTEMRRVPKLAEADISSFLGAVMQCAQLGLEPGGALGHAYLLPFWNSKRNVTEVQFIVGYRGMLDLARRSGQIESIEAHAVYEGDKFTCKFGLNGVLEHEPDWENPNRTDSTKLKFVYAVAHLKGGGRQFEVMSRGEIEAIRARSKSSGSGPWVSDYVAMALKTVIRRLFKYLPVSIEMTRAVVLDEAAENDLPQNNADVLDGDFSVLPDQGDGDEPVAEQ